MNSLKLIEFSCLIPHYRTFSHFRPSTFAQQCRAVSAKRFSDPTHVFIYQLDVLTVIFALLYPVMIVLPN